MPFAVRLDILNGHVDLIHSFGQVQDRYLEDGNDKLKLLVLLCSEDDEKLQRAAAGALAMLTSAQKKIADKITKVVCYSSHDYLMLMCLFFALYIF